jgi:hypothetical protein
LVELSFYQYLILLLISRTQNHWRCRPTTNTIFVTITYYERPLPLKLSKVSMEWWRVLRRGF